MKRIACLVVGILIGMAIPLQHAISEEVPMDEVVAVGQASDGEDIYCAGSTCSLYYMFALGATFANDLLQNHNASFGDTMVDRDQFCDGLDDLKPESCGSTPMATPLFSVPQYTPNGCGSAAGGALETAVEWLIPGTLDEPYSGVQFESACNTHDICYASQITSRGTCDTRFQSDLQGVCSGVSSSVQSDCNSAVGHYYNAVDAFGGGAWDSGTAINACAQWHHEMDANSCEA